MTVNLNSRAGVSIQRSAVLDCRYELILSPNFTFDSVLHSSRSRYSLFVGGDFDPIIDPELTRTVETKELVDCHDERAPQKIPT